jgi:hypothetical protein
VLSAAGHSTSIQKKWPLPCGRGHFDFGTARLDRKRTAAADLRLGSAAADFRFCATAADTRLRATATDLRHRSAATEFFVFHRITSCWFLLSHPCFAVQLPACILATLTLHLAENTDN